VTANHHKFKDSSSIDACDYHDDSGTLVIHFSSGQTYHYPECPKTEYEALKQAASVGRHFHSNIRKYKSIKVT
jgi:hypothetical protein